MNVTNCNIQIYFCLNLFFRTFENLSVLEKVISIQGWHLICFHICHINLRTGFLKQIKKKRKCASINININFFAKCWWTKIPDFRKVALKESAWGWFPEETAEPWNPQLSGGAADQYLTHHCLAKHINPGVAKPCIMKCLSEEEKKKIMILTKKD